MATRLERNADAVFRALAVGGTLNIDQIMNSTGLSHSAASAAVKYLRDTKRYITVPTKGWNWTYKIAESMADMAPGSVNQDKHLVTACHSRVTRAEASVRLAKLPHERALANAELLAAEAALASAKSLSAVSMLIKTGTTVTVK